MVVFWPEAYAQRAAVGIGTRLKQTFGGSRMSSDHNLGNGRKTLQGEQEYDNSCNGVKHSTALRVIATEKSGLFVAMFALFMGYSYIFLLQREKIDKIEQAIACGECCILACLLYWHVVEGRRIGSILCVVKCTMLLYHSTK